MSELGDALNEIASVIGSEVAPVVFPDTCSIFESRQIKTASKAVKKRANEEVYMSVPCSYTPTSKDFRDIQSDKTRSVQEYLIKIPAATALGGRYNFDIKIHRIVTDARGNEPQHTFRPVAVGNVSGVVFEIVCEKEN